MSEKRTPSSSGQAEKPSDGNSSGAKHRGLTTRIVKVFTTSQLSLLFMIAALFMGIAALYLTPREEDPQIVVPVLDVLVQYPGASAEEVEKLVATPLEVLLKQIEGVEYVYSVSRPGEALVTVRYFVGEDLEDSLVKTWSKVMSNQDLVPEGVTNWLVKPVDIDDVPALLVTLSSANDQFDSLALRRIADELLGRLRTVENVGRSWVVGGARRRVSVYPDPAKLAARGVSLVDVIQALRLTNINIQTGSFDSNDREILLDTGPYYTSADEVESTVIRVVKNRPVFLRDVARVLDGPEDTEYYTRIGFGPAVKKMRTLGNISEPFPEAGEERSMVTLAVAKRKGSNAVQVVEEVIAKAEQLRGSVVPKDVTMTITRDYGKTANDKVNELVEHLLFAVAIIMVLLAFSMGIKEALIVSIAVPVTFAVALMFDLLFGYTINRVTLFALILSLGLLVDDPIVDVENIFRHYKLRREPPLEALLTAVDEVRPPTILATFTVIVSFLPMFYITGMMGPYMAPMAFNVPVAMLISLLVAFTITPWACYRLLSNEYGHSDEAPFDLKRTAIYRIYDSIMRPLISVKKHAWLFLAAVMIAFIGSSLLAVTRIVPLKLLPFDNKNELQLVIDMPRGTTLENTNQAAQALGRYLATVNEVTDYETYIGLASPMDFNGMVRHYYLRRGGYVGEIRINLLDKRERQQQSHAVVLRIRKAIDEIAQRYGANVKIIEIPPGPPVLSTLVAEVYPPPEASYRDLIEVTKNIRKRFERTDGVVDVDDYSEAPHQKILFRLDRQKSALTGIAVADVAETLRVALGGQVSGHLHISSERLPLEIVIRLPRALRSSAADLLSVRVKTRQGMLVPLSELGTVEVVSDDQPIYHKNLRRVHYVIGDTAGRSPVDAVIDLYDDFDNQPLPEGFTAELSGEGEWKITVDVFRDLGLAFGAALLLIYVLLVAQTGSLSVPLVMMIAIPLTVIGIMPGFWLLNTLFAPSVAGYDNPIYFTATAMIGMIALAGIVVRNSIILIEFIERIRHGNENGSLIDAIIEAGAIRFRPIFLTAAAAMLGSLVIILDPVFSGLAWSFIFGIFASTAFSLFVIPVVYYLINVKSEGFSASAETGS